MGFTQVLVASCKAKQSWAPSVHGDADKAMWLQKCQSSLAPCLAFISKGTDHQLTLEGLSHIVSVLSKY